MVYKLILYIKATIIDWKQCHTYWNEYIIHSSEWGTESRLGWEIFFIYFSCCDLKCGRAEVALINVIVRLYIVGIPNAVFFLLVRCLKFSYIVCIHSLCGLILIAKCNFKVWQIHILHKHTNIRSVIGYSEAFIYITESGLLKHFLDAVIALTSIRRRKYTI